MKSLSYAISILAFSALVMAPKIEQPDPPKIVINNQHRIIQQEKEVNNLICIIEYNLSLGGICQVPINE